MILCLLNICKCYSITYLLCRDCRVTFRLSQNNPESGAFGDRALQPRRYSARLKARPTFLNKEVLSLVLSKERSRPFLTSTIFSLNLNNLKLNI